MLLAASSGHTSQSLEDKLYALKYFISGQGIPFVVVKATTSELIGPKRKHLNYLITMSNEPNVSIPSIVKHLIIRARHPDWPIAFKSLIALHQLITYGHEHLIQNIASSLVNSKAIESLCSFSDQTTSLAHNMSIFTRRYARYLSTKIQSYRTLGVDFCRAKPVLRVRDVSLDKLLQTTSIIQNQFDTLLAFDASLEALNNGIINSAFIMLYKDFVKLYIVYQVTIIQILKQYFASDNLKEAREMFALYKKFLIRMDKVSDFMPVIDSVGLDKRDMPNLSRVPNLPLSLFERHLEKLEQANKRTTSTAFGDYSSLGRVDYGYLGRPRRRSFKTPTRQMSIDILSPMAARNYKRRNEELKHLDKMMSWDSNKLERRRPNGFDRALTTANPSQKIDLQPSSSVIVECDSESAKLEVNEDKDLFGPEILGGQEGSQEAGCSTLQKPASKGESLTRQQQPAWHHAILSLNDTFDEISVPNESATTNENFPSFDKLTKSDVQRLNETALNSKDSSGTLLTTSDNLDPYATLDDDDRDDDSYALTSWVKIPSFN